MLDHAPRLRISVCPSLDLRLADRRDVVQADVFVIRLRRTDGRTARRLPGNRPPKRHVARSPVRAASNVAVGGVRATEDLRPDCIVDRAGGRVRRVPWPEVISPARRRRRVLAVHTFGKLATSNAPDGGPETNGRTSRQDLQEAAPARVVFRGGGGDDNDDGGRCKFLRRRRRLVLFHYRQQQRALGGD